MFKKNRKNLIISFVISYAIYLAVTLLLDATMITSVLGPIWRLVGLYLIVPWLAFQMAYGVGPACFPMVPTCLLQDAMLFVQSILPMHIDWPQSLQTSQNCLTLANSTSAKAACLKSCRSSPFYFQSWESSVSWFVCNALVKKCDTLYMPDIARSFTTLPQAFANHSEIIAKSLDDPIYMDVWHGHQFCFFMTLGQLMPYIFLLIGAAYALVQLMMLPVLLFSAGMQFAWQAVAYTHLET